MLHKIKTRKLPKVIRENMQTFIIGGILVLLLLGTFAAVQLSQRIQDLRQDASIEGGPVNVTVTQDNAYLTGSPNSSFSLNVNTGGTQITGVQVEFYLEGAQPTPVIEPVEGSGLELFPFIEPSGDGYLVTIIAPAPASFPFVPYATTSDTPFARVVFTTVDSVPNVDRELKISFVQENSYALIADTTPPEDGLNTLQDVIFPIIAPAVQPDESPTPTICAMPTPPLCLTGERVECTPQTGTAVCMTCNCVSDDTPTQTPTNTPTITLTPTPTTFDPTLTITLTPTLTPTPIVNNPTATPLPATGGSTAKTCGQSCSSHADCAVNLLCYSGVCRLANNPTDSACNNPPDNGLQRSCNQYCADSQECQSGLTCYYNSCRNPRNLNDQYCAEPVVVRNETTVINRTVTVIITATPDPEPPLPTDQPEPDFGFDDEYEEESQVVPTEELIATETPWPTYAPVAQVSPAEEASELTMTERIQGWLKGLLIVAAAISVIFFLLWLLPLLFGGRRDNQS
jgi:hypothetical protein